MLERIFVFVLAAAPSLPYPPKAAARRWEKLYLWTHSTEALSQARRSPRRESVWDSLMIMALAFFVSASINVAIPCSVLNRKCGCSCIFSACSSLAASAC
jgi:hypothetical protein